MAERLHAGDSPARILERLSAEQPLNREVDHRRLSSKASVALTGAQSAGITLIVLGIGIVAGAQFGVRALREPSDLPEVAPAA